MTNVIILVVDVCIVMILAGIFNIIFFDAPIAILLIPLIILAGILAVWIVRKVSLEDGEDRTKDEDAVWPEKQRREKTKSKK